MKKLLLTFIFLIVLLDISAQKPRLESLKTSIEAKLKTVEGEFALAFKDLQTKKILFINEKESFHAASTMKTPVMIEIFKQAKAGKFKLTDSVLVENEFRSILDKSVYKMNLSDDSGDEIYKQIGKKMTIYDLTYQMITVSSNLATNILIDLVGAKNTNKSMRKLGAKDIQILRGVEDQKAFDKGLNNSVTAYDLMLIFEKIANNKIIDKKSCEEMRQILFDQKFNEIIPKKLPKSIKVAHKTGSINGIQHDSGIIYLPDGKKYILILLSKKLKHTDAAIKILAEISEMLYEQI